MRTSTRCETSAAWGGDGRPSALAAAFSVAYFCGYASSRKKARAVACARRGPCMGRTARARRGCDRLRRRWAARVLRDRATRSSLRLRPRRGGRLLRGLYLRGIQPGRTSQVIGPLRAADRMRRRRAAGLLFPRTAAVVRRRFDRDRGMHRQLRLPRRWLVVRHLRRAPVRP